MICRLICFFLFYIITIFPKKIIIFVHPSTVLGILSEKFLPAIQNINLPGFYEINKLSLIDKSYALFTNFLTFILLLKI